VGTTDNILYKNSDLPKRNYSAVEFLGQHRLITIVVNGQWTLQLKNDGNFEEKARTRPDRRWETIRRCS
jgi:hypothetical protein